MVVTEEESKIQFQLLMPAKPHKSPTLVGTMKNSSYQGILFKSFLIILIPFNISARVLELQLVDI